MKTLGLPVTVYIVPRPPGMPSGHWYVQPELEGDTRLFSAENLGDAVKAAVLAKFVDQTVRDLLAERERS
jgi:hypothetical protein